MTKFKGTKGKWRCVMPQGYGKSTLIMNGTDIICDMVKFEGKRYNALLISKAPEMLEMLKDIKDYLGSDKRQEVEQLIKEATEL